MAHFSVDLDCKFADGRVSSVLRYGDGSTILETDFDVASVLPKTIHAVVCSAFSDALAKSFNELLAPKDESK